MARFNIRNITFFNYLLPRKHPLVNGNILTDERGKTHEYAVDLALDLKTGEARSAIVVDLRTDEEWFLIGKHQLQEK